MDQMMLTHPSNGSRWLPVSESGVALQAKLCQMLGVKPTGLPSSSTRSNLHFFLPLKSPCLILLTVSPVTKGSEPIQRRVQSCNSNVHLIRTGPPTRHFGVITVSNACKIRWKRTYCMHFRNVKSCYLCTSGWDWVEVLDFKSEKCQVLSFWKKSSNWRNGIVSNEDFLFSSSSYFFL